MSPLFLIYSVGAWILCLCKAAYPISSLPPSTLFTVAHMLQHLHGLGHSHSINSMPENVSSSLSCLKTSRSQGKWDFNDAGVTNWAAITATGGLSSGDKQGIRIWWGVRTAYFRATVRYFEWAKPLIFGASVSLHIWKFKIRVISGTMSTHSNLEVRRVRGRIKASVG